MQENIDRKIARVQLSGQKHSQLLSESVYGISLKKINSAKVGGAGLQEQLRNYVNLRAMTKIIKSHYIRYALAGGCFTSEMFRILFSGHSEQGSTSPNLWLPRG